LHSRLIDDLKCRYKILAPATDADVGEAMPRHLVAAIDIAQIDEHRIAHDGLQPIEVERAKLVPFGDDK
jgi:hypothetical protein